MNSSGNAFADQQPHVVAVATLGREIDRRRRPLLPLANFTQIERLPKPANSLADQ